MGKNKTIKKIFHSRFLIFSLIFSFIFLLSSEAIPNRVESDSNKEFKPVVKVKEGREKAPAAQKEQLEKLIEEGKRLFQEEMDYEGAIRKFEEAILYARTRIQKTDIFFYLTLVYYATQEETGLAEFDKAIRKLIELDYYRELDKSICPPKYIELFQGVKKEYGALKVQSNPPGADVYLNDSKEPVGKTPLTIGSRAGSVKVRVKKGRKEKKELLEVIAGREIATSVFVLKGISALTVILGAVVLAGSAGAAAVLLGKAGNGGSTTGSIQVSSSPTGAQVYLNGSNTGLTTDCTLTDVSSGSHTVSLIREGYEDEQRSVSVTAGQTATVSVTLTRPSITIIELTSGTVWATGEEIEIKWQTSGSSCVSTGAGLDPLIHHGRNVLDPFQRRAFQNRNSQDIEARERGKLENSGSTEKFVILSSKQSKLQGISNKFSSSTKAGDIFNRRAKDIRDIKRNSRVGIKNIPVVPQISNGKFMPSGDIRVLALSYVKIDLYKGDTFNQTIVSSTENDGSYTWTVDSSLEDGTDYTIRIYDPNYSTSYGESEEFEINEFQDIEWVQIASGNFQMGDNFNEGGPDELPVHTVYLDTYYISKYEVTFEQYDAFCDDTSRPKPDDNGWGRGDRPVINVNYADVTAFCSWMSAETGETIYPPTEAQWEKAARGTDQRRYPWGDGAPNSGLTNYNNYVGETMPVGSYPSGVSPYGIHDMAGNVFEWCSDWYDANYYSSSPTNNPPGSSSGSYRVQRGGSWGSIASTVRSANRDDGSAPSSSGSGIGFRLCKDVPVAKSITVTEPTTSTIWTIGQSADITWTSTGAISDVKIDLYKGETFNQTIISSTTNDASYTWSGVDISLANGTDYKVRVSSTSDSTVYGDSDEFKISFPEVEWVQVPAGSFKMGDNFNEGFSDELPVHTVYLDTYYISKYEVTFEQYDEFCDATGRTKPSDEGWGRGDRPVIHVNWNDAKAFCDWMSGETGENIHLPTEAQWEKAARGTDQRRYPWGNGSPDNSLANYANNLGKTLPVGSYPEGVSPYGIHDMAGNVWEWCSDWYDYDYYSSSPTNNPQGPSSRPYHVRRGGSWSNLAHVIRSALRDYYSPSSSDFSVGFRLCKD